MVSRRTSLIVLTALACAVVAQAQTSQTAGAIRSIVTNKKGELVAGASIVVHNLETGLTRTGKTGSLGDYTFQLLPTGRYAITVSATGLMTLKNSQVSVTLGNSSVVNLVMDSAEASAVVEVVSTISNIDMTQTSTVASVDQKLVEEIPLVGRNFTDMARLSPGVVSGAGSGNTPRMIVEGGRQIFNAIQIDGASNNSMFFNEQRGGVYTPFVFGADTIKELQIVTNGFDVQYGQAGATVNAITKTGTNEFTGSALYEVRRSSWSANPKPVAYDPNNTFNTSSNLQRFNDSSNINFNVGGPIIKDKLWYFVGMEHYHKSITANPVPTTISGSAGMTQADLDAMLASPLGKVVTNRGGQTLAQEMGDPGQGIPAHSYPMENTNTVYFGRLDYAMNENHRFVGRVNYQTMDDTLTNTSANPNNAESNNIPTKVESISWVLESDNIWTNELVTENRLQLAREARPMRNNSASGVPAIAIPTSGASMSFGTKTSTPRESNELTTQFFSATTWSHDVWQVKGGVDLMKVNEDNQFFNNNAGSFQFATYALATAWADGTLNASTPGMSNSQGINYAGAISPYRGRIPMWTKTGSLFGQVQYSGFLSQRLLLTGGFRSNSQSFSNNPVPNPNFAGLDQGYGGHTLDGRLAFCLDLDGKGKTVIRGGLGSYTSPTPLLLHSNTMTGNGQIITNYGLNLRANSPAGVLTSYTTGALGAGSLISGSSMRNLTDSELVNLPSAAGPTSLWDPANKLSQSKKINLGMEHDFGNQLVLGVSATYVHYLNLQRFENINLRQHTAGLVAYNDGYPESAAWFTGTSTEPAVRPGYAIIRGNRVSFLGSTPGNPSSGFSDVYLVRTDGWGYYRGLSFTAKKTWSEKTGFYVNLTYSKAMDTGSFERGTYTSNSGDFSSELGASVTPDPQNPASNYGYGDSDRRLVVNAVAYFPIVWGIEVSVRGLYQSGLPYTAYDYRDLDQDGVINDISAGHTRNDLRMPGYSQFDIRLCRSFKIPATHFVIEGNLDVYNIFNRNDQYIPSPAGYKSNALINGQVVANPSFGQLANVYKDKTREVQLGIRVKF